MPYTLAEKPTHVEKEMSEGDQIPYKLIKLTIGTFKNELYGPANAGSAQSSQVSLD
jgi:hypothetical protein